MKLYKLLLLGGISFLASSCAEDVEPSIPQHNPQEPIVALEDITSEKTGVLASDAVLNLEDYRADGSFIPVMKLVKADSLPEGATISYKLELSNTDTFQREEILDTEAGAPAEDGTVVYSVSAKDWNEAHLALFGKSPKEKVVYYRVPAYINVDGSDYRLNSVDYYVAEGTLTETCMDSGFVIEDNYYFLSNATTWNLGDADEVKKFAFTHDPDVSVYDDPVFKFAFELTQETLDANGGGCWWKIAPESAVGTDNWGVVIGTEIADDESFEGMLVTENAQSGKLTQAGNYEITINMETMSYTIEYLLQPKYLYTPGATNDWNQLASAWLQLKEDKGVYYGLSPLATDGFKISEKDNWNNPTDWGVSQEVSDSPVLSGTLLNGSTGIAQNIKVKENGLYWMMIGYDPTSYALTTYEFVPISRVGLIGSFAASAWGDDIEMTSEDDGATWSVTTTFKKGDKYKVRFNNAETMESNPWTYNLGGDVNDLTWDGADIEAEEDGDFTVTLKLLGGVPTITLTKK